MTTIASSTSPLFATAAPSAYFSDDDELDRLYRDVRTGSLHPPNTDVILDVIGKTAVHLFP
ncbi:acyl-CoA/acyl-ACP dehydrogenase [Paractinoplanes durhamensis]|uniref:Uncharacterized protein n=1 Tax=Paractinoplanes durhamensis TaxID=113563 RepID=A0ABQ3YSH9_9ACTN|nr:acyl-CoA/acyl-ACP dehydrogenase [Actinoplanes durhamensis]GIE00329.1 hypothetical protein Adu01nite_16790 [Actinoplanes durhamensis]